MIIIWFWLCCLQTQCIRCFLHSTTIDWTLRRSSENRGLWLKISFHMHGYGSRRARQPKNLSSKDASSIQFMFCCMKFVGSYYLHSLAWFSASPRFSWDSLRSWQAEINFSSRLILCTTFGNTTRSLFLRIPFSLMQFSQPHSAVQHKYGWFLKVLKKVSEEHLIIHNNK